MPELRDGPAGWVVISVSDNGTGIPAEVLPHVFEPFFTTKGGGGSGLGLPSVHGFVTQSDGYISVVSRSGAGTRFYVLLPQAPLHLTPTPPPAALPTPDRAGAQVLVVDDDPLVRRTTERVLRVAGFTVRGCEGAEAALELLRTGTFDVLVTDVQMPRISGVDLARSARRHNPRLKVIFVSGYTKEVISDELDGPLVQKPFDPAMLVSAVRRALGSAPAA